MDTSCKQSIIFHERPIVDLKFHKSGEVFFTASKDASSAMGNLKGEIIGSFDKHSGAISSIGPSDDSLATAGADLQLINWDIFTGKVKNTLNIDAVVRGIDFQEQILFCTDDSMNKKPFLGECDPRNSQKSFTKQIFLQEPATRLFKVGDFIIFSTTTGKICKIDLRNDKTIQEVKVHQSKVTDMKPCKGNRPFFITCSSDCSSKIIDTESFAIKKRFDSEEPINSACIFNTCDKIILVGGINARDVTITQGKSSFDTQFYDIPTQQKVGTYTTHFGTINAVDIHPEGTHYVSGGEDGSICLVKLGKDFKNAPFSLI